MSEPPVTIEYVVDTAQARADIESLKAAANAAVKKSRLARQEIMKNVRAGLSAVSQMMTSFSMAAHLLGANIDSFYAALIGMTLSTISMMLSIAAGLASTVVGIPASVIVFGIAATIQMITIEKLIIDKMNTEGILADLEKAATKGLYTYRTTGVQPPSGGF